MHAAGRRRLVDQGRRVAGDLDALSVPVGRAHQAAQLIPRGHRVGLVGGLSGAVDRLAVDAPAIQRDGHVSGVRIREPRRFTVENGQAAAGPRAQRDTADQGRRVADGQRGAGHRQAFVVAVVGRHATAQAVAAIEEGAADGRLGLAPDLLAVEQPDDRREVGIALGVAPALGRAADDDGLVGLGGAQQDGVHRGRLVAQGDGRGGRQGRARLSVTGLNGTLQLLARDRVARLEGRRLRARDLCAVEPPLVAETWRLAVCGILVARLVPAARIVEGVRVRDGARAAREVRLPAADVW